ncbi:MAG TPA: DNA translocase FtsK [Terriglobia bacterium]|nr:DNA translocase FtsK [Terriglobia bacterium]
MPTPSSGKKGNSDGAPGGWLAGPERQRELAGFLLVVLGLLILFSLVSYFLRDPSLDTSGAVGNVHNWIGVAGSYSADALYQLFGWVTYLIPAGLFFLGVGLIRTRPLEAPRVKVLGLVLMIMSLGALLELFPYTPRIDGVVGGSGLAGYLVAAGLVHVFNRLGATIVTGTVFLSSLFLVTKFSFSGGFTFFQSHFTFVGALASRWQAWREKRRNERLRRQVERIKVTGKQAVVMQQASQLSPRFEPKGESPQINQRQPAVAQPTTAMQALHPLESDAGALPTDSDADSSHGADKEVVPKPPKVAGRGSRAYKLPSHSLLLPAEIEQGIDENDLKERAVRLTEKFSEFGVMGTVTQIHPGPVVTTYEFKPEAGIKYSRIVNLADDLCLALKAESILIERIPGKSTVGIEVPNPHRETIHLRETLESTEFVGSKSKLVLCLGKDITGKIRIADLAQMPHLLIAGSTGTGKSVSINSFIVSVLYKARPDEVKLILIDPKRLELNLYEGVPHLFTPIVTEPKQAANVLRRATIEMEERLKKLAEQGVRNIEQYNKLFEDTSTLDLFDTDPERNRPLPYIVIVIDELADLMMVEPQGVEEAITRLAQMARAVGIHLILSTQRPSVDVITGLIKANLPSRIAFRVASKVDSRTILDSNGAEALLGRGDMLFLPPGTSRLVRLHGALVTEKEIDKVVEWCKAQCEPEYNEEFIKPVRDKDDRSAEVDEDVEASDLDEVYEDAVRVVVESGKASTSLLQRRLRLGYGRAARLLDLMERDGIISAPEGSKPREVLKRPDWLHEIDNSLR